MLVGVGGAALIAGGVLVGVTVAGKRDLGWGEANTRAGAGFIVGGVGLAVLAAGAIWAMAAPSAAPAATVGIAPTRGGAALCAAGSF